MKKPIRSKSGVVVVTLLTKPYACPGHCIFCPTYSNMPKSYLELEPAAQRALLLRFNPFFQTFLRLLTLYKNGHNVNKVEIIIDGGTWSFYPKRYQTYFIKGIFIALNLFEPTYVFKFIDKDITYVKKLLINPANFRKIFGKRLKDFYKESLSTLQKENKSAFARNVGLSVEERPDFKFHVLERLRIQGVTKVQLGIQSMNDYILKINKRGHTVYDNVMAASLLRVNGFKINAHFMPNLYKSDLNVDFKSYISFMKEIAPDEIKIYPTILFKNTPLYNYYLKGLYKQYTLQELMDLIIRFKVNTPPWVRINRIFRDVPAEYMQGIKIKSNLRELVHKKMLDDGLRCSCIRCRQFKGQNKIHIADIKFRQHQYETMFGTDVFIEAILPDDYTLLGFTRLFLPNAKGMQYMLKPIKGHALIRELHVYGNVLLWQDKDLQHSAQHIGIGTKLLDMASNIARKDFQKLSVISAIGTKLYYQKRGFSDTKLNYMTKILY